MDFFNHVDLSLEQVQCICRGLHSVALTDGVHPREEALIQEFYLACRTPGAPSYEDLIKVPFNSSEALETLRTPQLRQLFIKTCWLLAFADGKSTQPERELIARYASEMGVSSEQTQELQAEVKEYLLAQLSHLKNTAAVAEVAKQMKLT